MRQEGRRCVRGSEHKDRGRVRKGGSGVKKMCTVQMRVCTKQRGSERRVGGQKLVENEDEMKNKTGTPKNKEQTQRLH
ncbi:hypothetical protein PMAC_000261 [Pneumocystis sp. 'macacae']|nr:hypothetical protein PMAC_000261 [Pneumocystis sp. 'macacae']